jgi:predicted O-methyltransferase YrrM
MRIKNWFSSGGRRRNFKRALKHLIGTPAAYLEIGVFRGDSLTYVLQNILTHEDSSAIGVDPWLAECMGRPWTQAECEENRNLSIDATAKYGEKCQLYRQKSSDWFQTCGPVCHEAFDAIYLDGMHDYEPLQEDFLSAWPLLKVGGILIIDDLGARHSEIGELMDDLTPEYGSRWEVLFKNYQWGCKKVAL